MSAEPLQKLKDNRNEWLAWYEGDDPHAITKQIVDMIWDTAAYRVINEARKHAPPANEGGVQLNGMMHRLIDDSFFQAQALAIRRLVDRETSAGEKAVYSLWRLVHDIECSARLLTRENILAAEGLEYDYKPIREAWYKKHSEDIRAGGPKATFVPQEYWWQPSETRHEHIDRLAGVSGAERNPSDTVRLEAFARLKEKLAGCDQVVTYVNKFVAHAASPESRAAAYRGDGPSMTLAHLYQAHEMICKVANFVSVYLLGGAEWGFLAIPQLDQFAYIDRPLVATPNVGKLPEAWDAYAAEVDGWRECDDIFQW